MESDANSMMIHPAINSNAILWNQDTPVDEYAHELVIMDPENLSPSTHAWYYKTNDGEAKSTDAGAIPTQTGLIYVDNTNIVSINTGYEKAGDPLEYAAVPISSDDDFRFYYRDYVFRVATFGKEMPLESLVASLSILEDAKYPAITEHDYRKSASVDFYLLSSEDEIPTYATYKGTLNIANLDYTNNGKQKTQVEVISKGDKISALPLYDDDDNQIWILLRFYMDGELVDSGYANKTSYIHVDGLQTKKFGMDIKFEVIEPETTN